MLGCRNGESCGKVNRMTDDSPRQSLCADRVKHLEFIQVTVNRLAGNSFLMKGWTVTLIAALFALAAKESQQRYAVISLLPALCFWGLDAYYLRQERLFRKLYEYSAPPESKVPVYSMNPGCFASDVKGWAATLNSHTIGLFYGPIVIAILVAIFTTNSGPVNH